MWRTLDRFAGGSRQSGKGPVVWSEKSVVDVFGVDAEAVAEIVGRKWDGWVGLAPGLVRVACPARVAQWVSDVDRDEQARVVSALSWLSWEGGGDDCEAALVLAWVMRPMLDGEWRRLHGWRLGWQSPWPMFRNGLRGDQLVAHAAWVMFRAKCFDGAKPLAAMRAELHRRVQLDAGDPRTLAARRQVECVCFPSDPNCFDDVSEPPRSAWAQLVDLLRGAARSGLISEGQRVVLLECVRAANECGERFAPSATSRQVAEIVGPRLGLGRPAVLDSARSAVDSLSSAAVDGRLAALR
jgi:hypothetical protein